MAHMKPDKRGFPTLKGVFTFLTSAEKEFPMTKRLFRFTPPIGVCFILLLVLPCFAGELDKTGLGLWGGLGLGKSSLGRPAIAMNLSLRSDELLVSIRKSSSDGGSFRVASNDDSYDTMEEIGLLVGIAHRGERFIASLAAGVAGVRGSFHEPIPGAGDLHTESEYPTTAGVPLEAQLIWRAGSKVGFGIYGYQNFNKNRHFGGLCLSVMFGRF